MKATIVIMKNKLWITGLMLMAFLITFSSCKKEDDIQVSTQDVNGTFHAFVLIINGTTTELPTKDEKMDVSIKTSDKKHAKVWIIDYYKGNKDTVAAFSAAIGKDDDGSVILNEKTANGQLTVTFYDKNTIDLEGSGTGQNIYLGASKDGKKPDWW